METILFEDITKITAIGIYYKINDQKGFVNFSKCYENWLNYRKRNSEKVEKTNYRYIGQRNSCERPIYIELFNKPFIRIEFKKDNKEEFVYLRNKINLLGWETFDLS